MALSASKWGVQVLSKARPTKAVNLDWKVGKYNNQLDCIVSDAAGWEKRIWKINYISSEYCKFGTLNHDQLSEYEPVVMEARRRMTDDEVQARYFRVNRSMIMSSNHQVLPEDQWTPMDAEHNYLNTRMHDVEGEITEKKLFKCATLDFDDKMEEISLIPYRIRNYFAIKKLRETLKNELIYPRLA